MSPIPIRIGASGGPAGWGPRASLERRTALAPGASGGRAIVRDGAQGPEGTPGTAPRAFTERARNGEMHLARAILERTRQGRKPKGFQRDRNQPGRKPS